MEKYRDLLFGTGEQRNPGANGQRVKRGISKKRHRFAPKRTTGARPMRHVEADGLTTLRDLRLKPLG